MNNLQKNNECKDVLVLGGTRYFGRSIVDELLAAGHQVTIFTRGNLKHDFSSKVTHIIGDGITDCDVWRKGYADEFYAFTENIERTVVVNSSKNVINCLNDYIKIIS